MATQRNATRTPATTATTAGKAAPTLATVATPTPAVVPAPTMLPVGSALCNGTTVASAVATTAGRAYTVPANGGNGVVHYVALHTAPTTAGRPQCWPGLYSGASGATTATVAGGPTGCGTYTTHAVHVPATGPATWAVVHCYPGKAGASPKAGAHGNGTMVASAAGTGAVCGGTPCAATLALAATHGLAAPKGAR